MTGGSAKRTERGPTGPALAPALTEFSPAVNSGCCERSTSQDLGQKMRFSTGRVSPC